MDTLTKTEEEQVVERIVRNQLAIKELEEENAVLKQYFKASGEAYPAGQTKQVGKFYIKVTTNSRVDDALARVVLDSRTYDRLTKRVIDGPAAKRALSPENYAKIVKMYDNKIEVGLV